MDSHILPIASSRQHQGRIRRLSRGQLRQLSAPFTLPRGTMSPLTFAFIFQPS